jgi:hypothetical protein
MMEVWDAMPSQEYEKEDGGCLTLLIKEVGNGQRKNKEMPINRRFSFYLFYEDLLQDHGMESPDHQV